MDPIQAPRVPWGPALGQRLLGHGLAVIIDAFVRTRFRIEVRRPDRFSESPATLVASNHRRDADAPILATLLGRRRGLRYRGILPSFVARADLFRRGFLRDYLESWPEPLRERLSGLDLSPILAALGAHPMSRPFEQSLGHVLEDVLDALGDRPLEEVLRPRTLARFQAVAGPSAGPLRVSDVLSRPYRALLRRHRGFARLERSCFVSLLPYERAVIAAQLEVFVQLLDRGGVLLLEPEGVVSRSGGFGRFREGLYQLVNRPRADVRVLPVGITYDFMTTARPRVFVNFGPELTHLRGLSRDTLEHRVGRAIAAQTTVTASQLASRQLRELQARGGGDLTSKELSRRVGEEAGRYVAAGHHVDPRLLDPAWRGRRVLDWLAYLSADPRLVEGDGRRFAVHDGHDEVRPGLGEPAREVAYATNELEALTDLSGVPKA